MVGEAPNASLATEWTSARGDLINAVPPADRQRFDALVVELLTLAYGGRPLNDPYTGPRLRGFLKVGVATASTLVRHAPVDLELLATAAVLPCFDGALHGSRGLLLGHGPIDWPVAMLLAMTPAGARSIAQATDGHRGAYLRQLAALPAPLRAIVMLERAFAAGTPELAPTMSEARPFDQAELAVLTPGIARELWPAANPPADPGPADPLRPPAPPVGSPAEAVELVSLHPEHRFGSYLMMPDGPAGFRVDGLELTYRVRWDVAPDAIHAVGPMSYPGDQEDVRFREPGWIVDRVTREVTTAELDVDPEWTGATRRVFPLPPGWQLGIRPPIAEGIAVEAAALLPASAAPVIAEATQRYAARLDTGAWPDFLVAWRVAAHTVGVLRYCGIDDPDLLVAALLAGRGPAAGDTLVDEASPLWGTPAGERAAIARPRDDELEPFGARQRAERLAAEPAPVRALVMANLLARSIVEGELFGVTPARRHDERLALAALTVDLPDPLRG